MAINVTEWKWILSKYGHCCAVCGVGESICGGLVKAHIVARSKGGSQIVPMCANCDKRFDSGQLNTFELSKLGIADTDYSRHQPNGRTSKPKSNQGLLGDFIGDGEPWL